MKKIKAVVSLGDLYDRISILGVKVRMIPDQDAIDNVVYEMASLMSTLAKSDHIFNVESMQKLDKINQEIWDLETNVRKDLNDKEFISVAKSIFEKNTIRAGIKRDINKWNDSSIIEEKYHE